MRFGCIKQLNLLVVLGWVQIFPLLVGWVGSVSWWVGLDWVTPQNGPMDNSGLTARSKFNVITQKVSLKWWAVKNFKIPRKSTNCNISWWRRTGLSSISAIRHLGFLKWFFKWAGHLRYVLHNSAKFRGDRSYTVAEISRLCKNSLDDRT